MENLLEVLNATSDREAKINLLSEEIKRLSPLSETKELDYSYCNYVFKIYEICVEIDYEVGVLNSAVVLSNLLIDRGDINRATKLINEALETANEKSDINTVIRLLNGLAVAFYMDGNYENSFEYLLRLYNLGVKHEIDRAIAVANVNMGDIYRLLGDFESAEDHFLKVITQYEEGYKIFESTYKIALMNMCECIIDNLENENRNPEDYFDKFEKILPEGDVSFDHCLLLDIKAKYYKLIKEYEKAEIFFLKAFNYYNKLNQDYYYYECIYNYADMLNKIGRSLEAYELLTEKAIEKSYIDSNTLGIKFNKLCAEIAESLNDYEGAIAHYKLVMKYKGDDKSNNASTLKRIFILKKQHKYITDIESLKNESTTDQLTKLYNRTKLFNDFKELLSELSGESDIKVSIMMVDLDNFKYINDYHGHVSGDKCLETIGNELKALSTQNGGSAYRYGGDEFLLIHKLSADDSAWRLGEEVRKRIKNLNFVAKLKSKSVRVTASVGVLEFIPHSDLSPKEIIKEVDMLMYEAKKDSKDKTVIRSHSDFVLNA